MRSRYRRCPSASAHASALVVSAALMLTSCGGATAGQPARPAATRATTQQEIRASLAQLYRAFRHRDFKRACGLLVPISEPPNSHVFVKPQDLPMWEAVCMKRLSANAKRGVPAGSLVTAKVQSIAVHGSTAEVFFKRTAAPSVFVKIAGRWRLGLVGGY